MKPNNLLASAAGDPSLTSVINGEILRRSAIIALLLGSILTLVNQSGAIFGGEAIDYLQMTLVYLLPFVVVSISQALGARRGILDLRHNCGRRIREETVLATVMTHGIPQRALFVGMLAGSVNASIGITSALLDGASAASLSLAPVIQAYTLPVLFGLLSQTIAYRRTTQSLKGAK